MGAGAVSSASGLLTRETLGRVASSHRELPGMSPNSQFAAATGSGLSQPGAASRRLGIIGDVPSGTASRPSGGGDSWAMRKRSCADDPWIDEVDTRVFEVTRVARRHRHAA